MKWSKIRKQCQNVLSIDEDKLLAKVVDHDHVKAQIIDLNQRQLYDQGVQSDGSETGQYAPITISYWKPLAASEGRDGRSDHITGKDTGITYRSMRVEAKPEGIVIKADDRNHFFDREPKGLGLTEESKSEIIPEILQRSREEFKKILHS